MKAQTTGSLLGLLVIIAQPTGSHAQTHFTIGVDLAIVISIGSAGVLLVFSCCVSLYRYHNYHSQPRGAQHTRPAAVAVQQARERHGEIECPSLHPSPSPARSGGGYDDGPPGVKAPLQPQLLTQAPPTYSQAIHYPTYTAVQYTTPQQCELTDKASRSFDTAALHSSNIPSGSSGYENMPADGCYVVHSELAQPDTRGEQQSFIDASVWMTSTDTHSNT